MASLRGIGGKIVVRRRASIDFPAPGGPSMRTLWSNVCNRFTCSVHVTAEGGKSS
jgi:hypothetical protein